MYYSAANGSLRVADLDASLRAADFGGPHQRTIAKTASSAAVSRDGTRIAFLASAGGHTEVFVAGADGSHARDVSHLGGLDAGHPAWLGSDRLVFTASGNPPPQHTYVGSSLAEAANLLEAVLVMGLLLLIVHRWRAPLGTCTVLLTLFAVAMTTQSDTYADAIAAFATGVVADIALFVLKERARTGIGFYAFAFGVSALFFSAYLVTTIIAGGTGTAWSPDMLLGSPLLAGIAGLLVAFCYEQPLPQAATAPP